MRVRRLRAGLKGWGGVGAMAVVLVLTAVFVLLPLARAGGTDQATGGVGGLAEGVRASAHACQDPEKRSLSPREPTGTPSRPSRAAPTPGW